MKKVVVAIFILLLLGGTACFLFKGKNKVFPLQKADSGAAKMMLENLAFVIKTHSAQNGGGGSANFAKDLSEVYDLCASSIKPALPGADQTDFRGYIVRLEEYPAGDNFATNFKLVAYPAPGYEGETFYIDKKENVEKSTDK